MDQRIVLNNRICTRLDKIITSIQKTQTYIDANTFSLIGQGTAETAGASGALAFLGVLTLLGKLDIEIAATSDISGSLNVTTELGSKDIEIAGVGSVEGYLDILTELGQAAIIEIASVGGMLGELDVSTVMRGIAAGVSGADGFLNHHLFSGDSDGAGGADAYLNSEIDLVGSCAEEFSVIGQPFLR